MPSVAQPGLVFLEQLFRGHLTGPSHIRMALM